MLLCRVSWTNNLSCFFVHDASTRHHQALFKLFYRVFSKFLDSDGASIWISIHKTFSKWEMWLQGRATVLHCELCTASWMVDGVSVCTRYTFRQNYQDPPATLMHFSCDLLTLCQQRWRQNTVTEVSICTVHAKGRLQPTAFSGRFLVKLSLLKAKRSNIKTRLLVRLTNNLFCT